MTHVTIPPNLRQPLAAFSATPQTANVHPLGKGNINDTWLVEEEGRWFVLQRINSSVFPAPDQIIENFRKVTDHINARQGRRGPPLICPRLVDTCTGEPGFKDDSGEWWRAQTYIHQSSTPSKTAAGEVGESLGKVLASFHLLTGDLDPEHLHRPLPDFHVTPVYLEKYKESRRHHRRKETKALRDCFHLIDRFSFCAATLEDARDRGRLSIRTIHGDPKLDNVIVGYQGLAVGLYDLDTAGPGLIHCDLGDCLRSVCNRAGENSGQVENILFDADICTSVLKGYLETAGSYLGEWDRRYIYDAVLTITYELALRFITDYLEGNVYFKVNFEEENLFRGRVQLALASSIAGQEDIIREIAETGR